MSLVTLYENLVQPGGLVFDIGAFVGDLAAVFLDCGARVVAVEPQPDKVKHLSRRFGGEPVAVVGAAVGAVRGRAILSWDDGNPGMATLYPGVWYGAASRFRFIHPNRQAEVDVITLDDLISEYGIPAYIKLDIEGGELAALQGLTTPVRGVGFEYAYEFLFDAAACCDRLLALGDYSFSYTRMEGPALEVDWGSAADTLRSIRGLRYHKHAWGNILACRRD